MHKHNCDCPTHQNSQVMAYFDLNNVTGVSILSEDTELDICDATGDHADLTQSRSLSNPSCQIYCKTLTSQHLQHNESFIKRAPLTIAKLD